MNATAVVVTGAGGMLGSHLCRRLAARGLEVRALVRDPASVAGLPLAAVGRCELPTTLDERLLAGAGVLIHCAYATRVTDPEESRRVNEDGMQRVLDACRRAGVRVVFISTVAADPAAPNYYARSKYALESRCDPRRDLVVRPGLIVAREGRGLFQQMRDVTRRTHVVPLFGGGGQPLQTVHVDDLTEAIARGLERDVTGAINVAEPDPVDYRTFFRLLAARLGVRCAYVPLPFAPVLAGLRILERLRVPFPLRSESVLAIKGLKQVAVAADLRRLDLAVRPVAQSLTDVLAPP